MNTSNWIALLGVAVTVLVLAVGLLVRTLDRRQVIIDRLEAENRLLRDGQVDLKIALASLSGTAATVDRTLSAIPAPLPEGGGR